MTIPAPPKRHRLEACTSRFLFQLQRTKAYLDGVMPALAAQGETQNRQYCFQTIVLMLHTFVEEHYRWLVSLATLWRAEDVRPYLAKRKQDMAEQIEEMPFPGLMRLARKEVSFRDDGRKLKSIFQILFGVGPFADADAESKCLDLIRVRNIITHQGGLIEDEDLPQLSSPDVVVRREASGPVVFHHLEIQPAFFAAALAALGRSVAAIDESLKQDPRYSI